MHESLPPHLCSLLTLQGLRPLSLALPPWALGVLPGKEEGGLNQEDGLGQSLEKGGPGLAGLGAMGLGSLSSGLSGPSFPQLG